MADAIGFVLRRHGFRAGRHTVGYRSCDDSTAQHGFFDARTCAANANAYARAEKLVAVIGTFNSDCAKIELAARGLYVAQSDLPRSVLDPTPAAERFQEEFGQVDVEGGFVLEAAQTAELVLQAIARSDGTRSSVLEELKASRVTDGLLGSFRFDRNGDVTPATVPILRITGSTPPGSGLPAGLQGAVVDRVVEVPARLVD